MKVQELQGSLAEREEALVKLSKRLHEIETQTIWQKLKALFRLKQN
jgi:hypothetical protein